MSTYTIVTMKGEVVIPKAMRDRLGWRPGTRLRVHYRAYGGIAVDAAAACTKAVLADDPVERAFGAFRDCGADLISVLEAGHRAELADEGY